MTGENVMPLREPEALPRLPPINIEAEQSLLGAFLCNNRALEAVADFLKPEHFVNAMHGRILEAIQRLVDGGQTASPVTLKATFDQDSALAPIGGADYLARLAGAGASLTRDAGVWEIVYALPWARKNSSRWQQQSPRKIEMRIPAISATMAAKRTFQMAR